MAENRSKPSSLQLSADGELIAAKFCAYCGALNAADAAQCQDCGEYIADQGRDLSARLARIRRHASGIPDLATDLADRRDSHIVTLGFLIVTLTLEVLVIGMVIAHYLSANP